MLTGIHHLGLSVTDVAASASWYCTVLGFSQAGDYVSPDGSRHKIFLHHVRFQVRIGLCEHARTGADHFDETRPGLDHLAFAVDGVVELRAYEEMLRARGVPYTPAVSANTLKGAQILVLRDPDNIQLELVAAT